MLRLLIKKIGVNLIKILIFFGVVWYLYASGKLDISLLSIKKISAHKIAYAYLLLISVVFLGFIRLFVLLSVQKINIKFLDYLRACYFSNFFNLALAGGMGTMGEDGILCSYLTKQYGKKKFSAFAATILINRCCGLLALVIYAGLSMLLSLQVLQQTTFFPSILLGYSILLQALSITGLILFMKLRREVFYILAGLLFLLNLALVLSIKIKFLYVSVFIMSVLSFLIPKIETDFFAKHIEKFHVFAHNKLKVLAAFTLSFLIHLLSFISIFQIAKALFPNISIKFGSILLASPPSLICNVIPLPANALGVGELVFDTIVNLTTSVNLINGVMIFIIYRLVMYFVNLTSFCISFVIGLSSYAVKTRQIKANS